MSLYSNNSTAAPNTNHLNPNSNKATPNYHKIPNKDATTIGGQPTIDIDSSSDESEFNEFFQETIGLRRRKRAQHTKPSSDSDSKSESSRQNSSKRPTKTQQESSDETPTINPNDDDYSISTSLSKSTKTNKTRRTERTKPSELMTAEYNGDPQLQPPQPTNNRTIQQWIMDGIRWIRCKPIEIYDSDDSDQSGDESSNASSDGTTEPSTKTTRKTNDDPTNQIGESNGSQATTTRDRNNITPNEISNHDQPTPAPGDDGATAKSSKEWQEFFNKMRQRRPATTISDDHNRTTDNTIQTILSTQTNNFPIGDPMTQNNIHDKSKFRVYFHFSRKG